MLAVPASSSVITTLGRLVSTACTDWTATVLPLAARSAAMPAATSTVRLPSKFAVGVTVRVKTVSPSTPVNAPLVPPTTATSDAVKPLTASLNVKEQKTTRPNSSHVPTSSAVITTHNNLVSTAC